MEQNGVQRYIVLHTQQGISLAGAVVGMAMMSIIISVIAGVIANTFNIMNKTNSYGVMETSHLSALYFLKNPKNFFDPTTNDGILNSQERDCLLGTGNACDTSVGNVVRDVQSGSNPIVVNHQIPLCHFQLAAGGSPRSNPSGNLNALSNLICNGTTTITNTQSNLKGYLDKNGVACNWSGSGSTNCWYERSATYQLKDCTSSACNWVDVQLITRPLNDSSHTPYNSKMDAEVAMATRKINFGFNKFAVQGGRTINFNCAANSFATQIDYKNNKAICGGMNANVQNTNCAQQKKIGKFGDSNVNAACTDFPQPNCSIGFANLTLSSGGGTVCRN